MRSHVMRMSITVNGHETEAGTSTAEKIHRDVGTRRQESRRIPEKLEIVSTPKHGGWLNIAELEWAVLEKKATQGRVPNPSALAARVEAWNQDR